MVLLSRTWRTCEVIKMHAETQPGPKKMYGFLVQQPVVPPWHRHFTPFPYDSMRYVVFFVPVVPVQSSKGVHRAQFVNIIWQPVSPYTASRPRKLN
jgi:hypothetical protein